MVKEEIYCSLDIGSGRITGVIAKIDSEERVINILAGKQVVDKDAIAVGVIKDIERCAGLVDDLITALEDMAGVSKTRLVIGVRGAFVNTYDTIAQIPITSTDKIITVDDQERVVDHAIKSLRIPSDKTIMAIIPQEYIIDGQSGISNPVNMEGSLLEVRAHAVVAFSSFIRNIERTFSDAGHVIDEIYFGLIPLGQLITDSEERKMGCMVIDFGGQSTGVLVYKDGCIRYSKEFFSKDMDLGSDLVTRELAAYYKTSWNIAEDIKKRYGVSQPSLVKKDEQIEILSRDGKTKRITTKKEIAKIIAHVLEAIFLDKLIPELKKIDWITSVLEEGDIVLTGGGANLCGITEAVKELFKSEYSSIDNLIEVRPGSCIESGIIGEEEIISDFSYTTAISLIRYDIESQKKPFKNRMQNKGIKKIIKKIWSIFE